jgi:hypothetical protein
LTIDVTDLSDEQRRLFTVEVTDLLDQHRNYDEDENEDELVVLGWSSATLGQALQRLEYDGADVQAATIRKALESGGAISRAEVYRIGNYEAGRTLKGFTRPVSRIVNRMRAVGDVPAAAAELLESGYNYGVRADEFRVPAELAELLL